MHHPMQLRDFVAISNGRPLELLFKVHSVMPAVPLPHQLVALMKFWKSLSILLTSVDSLEWPSFVTYAFRRFIIFSSALQAHLDSRLVLHVMPPLDVLWVWHSLLQSPAACYASFAHNGFIQFLDVPFPLDRIGDCIDNQLFAYAPDALGVYNFTSIVRSFGFDLDYDIPLPLNPASIFYPVFSPVTGNQLGTVLLAQFVSPHMRFASGDTFVTHFSLTHLQTKADWNKKQKIAELPQFLNLKESTGPGSLFTIASGFFNALPLVHLTVGPHCVKLSGDWVSHALHNSVPLLVESLNWLFHGGLEKGLNEAIIRYKNFFELMSKGGHDQRVPTLDIRLVWSAHMSNFKQYADFSIYWAKCVVVPAADGVQTTSCLFRTAKRFAELFGRSYCQCKCKYCFQYGGQNVSDSVQEHSFSCARYIYDLLLPVICEGDEAV